MIKALCGICVLLVVYTSLHLSLHTALRKSAEVCGSVALILHLVEMQISLIVAQIIETMSESFRNKGWKGGSKYCQVFEYKVLKGKKKTLYLTLVVLEQGGSCCHLGPGFPLLFLVPKMLG